MKSQNKHIAIIAIFYTVALSIAIAGANVTLGLPVLAVAALALVGIVGGPVMATGLALVPVGLVLHRPEAFLAFLTMVLK